MPDSAPRIRKQVYELTVQDFQDHPIWEFCPEEVGANGQDEATVRPTEKRELSGELAGSCVVAANVKFADGSSGAGYLYNNDEARIGFVQPNLFVGNAQINFWLGSLKFLPNAPQRIPNHYKTIGKGKEAIFPLTFESAASVDGRVLRVVLQGFMARGLDKIPVVLV
jgi:hypothetical protein